MTEAPSIGQRLDRNRARLPAEPVLEGARVDQILPNISPGDATSDCCLRFTEMLAAAGADTRVWSVELHPERRDRAHRLDWRAHRLFARSGYCYGPALPRNAADYHATTRPDLYHLMRVYFANRGVWEAIGSAGPTISVAATSAQIDHYLACLDEFLGELTA